MDLAQLRRTLGLSETATEDDINAAIARGKAAVTLHASVAKAVGLKDDASEDAVLAAVKEKSVSVSTHAQGEISTLQSQIADQNKTIADLKGQMAKAASESWMDKLRTEKFVDEGTRSDLVTLHMQNPDMAEKIAKSLQDIPKAGVTLHMRQRGGTGGAADPSLTKMDEAFGLDPEKKD